MNFIHELFKVIFISSFVCLLYYFITHSNILSKKPKMYREQFYNINNIKLKNTPSTTMTLSQGTKAINVFYLERGDNVVISIDNDGLFIVEVRNYVYN